MNYNLNAIIESAKPPKASLPKRLWQFCKSIFSFRKTFQKADELVRGEWHNISIALVALIINAVCSLYGPYLTGYAIDHFVLKGMLKELLQYSLILLGVYAVAFVANFLQIRVMGGVGQRLLFSLRNKIFKKIQELPLEFFSQNKTGDLISRINSDTEKLSQFFSETLTRFLGSIFMIGGAGIFLVVIHAKLGTATLLPAIILWLCTLCVSKIVKKVNTASLKSTGLLSAEVQESLQNFKVIVAFNRRDYFRSRFNEINEKNYSDNYKAGIWNGIFTPLYDFAANIGQYVVLLYGIYLISTGSATLGVLVSFLAYAEKFYNPLRQMAQLWSTVQVSLAAWTRISAILNLRSNLHIVHPDIADTDIARSEVEAHTNNSTGININSNTSKGSDANSILEFKDVSFHYHDDSGTITKNVLHNVNFTLLKGKTYALVGPTGGGKTTTASLIARLYDPTHGVVYLKGKDIRQYEHKERVCSIGFILQDPIIFPGTLRDNLVYGNTELEDKTAEELEQILVEKKLDLVLEKFDGGLGAPLPKNIDTMSLGQKQIVAFVRAILREPEILILDEATANIDTVTEQVLEAILERLPAHTTKIIIAHRLNTIQNADTIYFVNNATVTKAGSIQDAVNMLLKNKKKS